MVTLNALNEYWLLRGEHYLGNDGYRLAKRWHTQQERHFVELVKASQPQTIIEVGCGFGRMTKAVALAIPGIRILASDISSHQLHHARKHCAGLNAEFSEYDLYDDSPFPMVADLAMAAEVFYHLPQSILRLVVARIFDAAPILIHDYDPQTAPGSNAGQHYFSHDYASVYGSMGLKCEDKRLGDYGFWVVSK